MSFSLGDVVIIGKDKRKMRAIIKSVCSTHYEVDLMMPDGSGGNIINSAYEKDFFDDIARLEMPAIDYDL